VSLSNAEAEEMRLATTRGVADAPLPVKYEAAKAALAACANVDECSTWAKKAAALASYARQSQDDAMEKMAQRIRARAIRRCGELLKEIPAKAHGREVEGRSPTSHPSARAAAAKAAGLSPDQTKDALRVARLGKATFEAAVESDDPATVAQLAELGTTKKPVPLVDLQGRDPAAFNRSLHLGAAINELAASLGSLTPEQFVKGCIPRQVTPLRKSAAALVAWLSDLLVSLEDT
jgi:hypothetical protein